MGVHERLSVTLKLHFLPAARLPHLRQLSAIPHAAAPPLPMATQALPPIRIRVTTAHPQVDFGSPPYNQQSIGLRQASVHLAGRGGASPLSRRCLPRRRPVPPRDRAMIWQPPPSATRPDSVLHNRRRILDHAATALHRRPIPTLANTRCSTENM